MKSKPQKPYEIYVINSFSDYIGIIEEITSVQDKFQ